MMNLPDIAGNNATVPIILPQQARWVQFSATGSGTAKVGGASVSATEGTPVSAGPNAGFMAPFMGQYSFYQTNEFFAYIPTGVTLSVSAKE